jgi:hypothetical protein
MKSKNSKPLTAAERKHLARVKECPCSVCNAEPPSSAHHIKQGHHFTTVALCADCHTDGSLGIHGCKTAWKIAKLDELDALNITLGRMLSGR